MRVLCWAKSVKLSDIKPERYDLSAVYMPEILNRRVEIAVQRAIFADRPMAGFHGFMPEPLRGLLKNHIAEFREAPPLGGGRAATSDAHLNALYLLRNGCQWRLGRKRRLSWMGGPGPSKESWKMNCPKARMEVQAAVGAEARQWASPSQAAAAPPPSPMPSAPVGPAVRAALMAASPMRVPKASPANHTETMRRYFLELRVTIRAGRINSAG